MIGSRRRAARIFCSAAIAAAILSATAVRSDAYVHGANEYKDGGPAAWTNYTCKVKEHLKTDGVRDEDARDPEKPVITSASASSSAVRLGWEKSECSGYKVQKYDRFAKVWSTVKLLPADKTACRIGGLDCGETYKFRIRTFTYGENGDKTFSAWSETADVTTESPYIIIGDSRVNAISKAAEVNDSGVSVKFIAKDAMGYDWFSSDALAALDDHLEQNKGERFKIVVCMGVNDVRNVDRYIKSYRALVEKYPLHKFYFVSVNPVSDNKSFSCNNTKINGFNTNLKAAFPDRYIDTNTLLKKNGFKTTDGLHYTNECNVYIFNKMIELTQ